MIIGVCGGSGSGKTTLVEAAFNHLTADTICRVSQDSYYKNNDTLSFEERCLLNYDHPKAIDYNLFISQIKGFLVTLSVIKSKSKINFRL